jgi:hypothetical protein
MLRLDITAFSSTVIDVETESLIFILPTPAGWLSLWPFSGTLDQVTREALYGMLHTMCLHTKLIQIILTSYLFRSLPIGYMSLFHCD